MSNLLILMLDQNLCIIMKHKFTIIIQRDGPEPFFRLTLPSKDLNVFLTLEQIRPMLNCQDGAVLDPTPGGPSTKTRNWMWMCTKNWNTKQRVGIARIKPTQQRWSPLFDNALLDLGLLTHGEVLFALPYPSRVYLHPADSFSFFERALPLASFNPKERASRGEGTLGPGKAEPITPSEVSIHQ